MVLFGYDPADASQVRYALTDIGKPSDRRCIQRA